MKASDKVKAAGLKSLNELKSISGVSTRTLQDWNNKKPLLFEVVLKGAVVKKLEGIH